MLKKNPVVPYASTSSKNLLIYTVVVQRNYSA